MNFLKIFFVACFLMACAGRQSAYTWPEKKEKHSLTEVVKKMKEDGFSKAVIFITSDWCPPCKRLKEYWRGKKSPVPLYEVDTFDITFEERYILILYGVPNQIPVCIIIMGDKHDIGVGYDMCADGLEVKLQKLR